MRSFWLQGGTDGDVHKNARLTPPGRESVVWQVMSGDAGGRRRIRRRLPADHPQMGCAVPPGRPCRPGGPSSVGLRRRSPCRGAGIPRYRLRATTGAVCRSRAPTARRGRRRTAPAHPPRVRESGGSRRSPTTAVFRSAPEGNRGTGCDRRRCRHQWRAAQPRGAFGGNVDRPGLEVIEQAGDAPAGQQ